MNPEYGRRDAEIFLSQVLPKATDVPIQIAHLAGWGGYPAETDAALSVFAEAFASGDRRVTNVYFDLSALTGVSPSTAERCSPANPPDRNRPNAVRHRPSRHYQVRRGNH